LIGLQADKAMVIERAGFMGLSELGHVETNIGTLDFISAKKPVNLNK